MVTKDYERFLKCMPVQQCFPIHEYNFSSTIQETHYNKVIRAGKKVGSIASDISLKGCSNTEGIRQAKLTLMAVA